MGTPTDNAPQHREIWEFKLYINGETFDNRQVESKLRKLCENYLGEYFRLQVLDINDEKTTFPEDLLAVPTIIRIHPLPERRVIRNLSSGHRAVEGLGLQEFGDW